MIRRYAAAFRLALVVADVVSAVAVLWCAWVLRFGEQTALTIGLKDAGSRPVAIFLFTFAWIGILWLNGCYGLNRRWTFRGRVRDILRATVLLAAIVLGALYLGKMQDVSRLYLAYVFPLLALATLAVRVAARLVMRMLREMGRGLRYMVVVGANRQAQAFADMVEAHHELNLRVIGHLTADSEDPEAVTRPVLGPVERLTGVLHSRIVDEVGVCLPLSLDEVVQNAVTLCEQEGRIVRIPSGPVERLFESARMEELDGIVIHSVVNAPDRLVSLLLKRALDMAGALLLLVLLAPFFAVVALVVKLDSPGPVFFWQDRVGINGRAFRVVKFRSMVVDAEERLEALQAQNAVHGAAFKLERDPRITRAGYWLRRTSIDEFPQLWNVAMGQMSLVGPRPPLPCEVEQYDIWHRRRLSMKPGMTGLWQVRARREPDFDRWVETDLEYIDRWSLWLDLKIIARTLPVMLEGQGR